MVEVLQHLAAYSILYFPNTFSLCIILQVILQLLLVFSVKKHSSFSRGFRPRCVHLSYLRLPIINIPRLRICETHATEVKNERHELTTIRFSYAVHSLHNAYADCRGIQGRYSFGLFLYCMSLITLLFLLTFEYFMYCSSLLPFLIFIFIFFLFFILALYFLSYTCPRDLRNNYFLKN